jgi:hypothetical protein
VQSEKCLRLWASIRNGEGVITGFFGPCAADVLTAHVAFSPYNSKCYIAVQNLQPVHGHCHDAKTREHKEHLPVGRRDKHRHTEERRDRKRSCAVLEQR